MNRNHNKHIKCKNENRCFYAAICFVRLMINEVQTKKINIFLAFFYLTKREKIAIIKTVLRNDVMNVLKEGDRFGKTN